MRDSEAILRTLLPESLEDALREGIRHAISAGADGAEAYVHVSRSRKAKVQNGRLEALTTSKRGGLGVRVLRDGRGGIATTTDLGRGDFRALFLRALDLAALGDQDPWLRQAEPAGTDDLPSRYDPRAEGLSPQDRIDRAQALEAAARATSSRVASVREAVWADGSGASLLLTQKGVRCGDVGTSCSASIELAVEEDGDRQAAWHWDLGRHPGAFDLEAVGREAAEKGVRKLKPRPFQAGTYPVLLHPEVTVDLLGIVAGMLSAESVLKHRSLFAGRLGEAIASPCLTLVDDGRLVMPDGTPGLGSEPWDGEGVPTRRNVLIEDGVLKTYLHTLKTAAEMGQEPTGSASRGTGSHPDATTFNLFPRAGTDSAEALYARAGTAVLLTEIMGLHTVDPVSGDLSVGGCGVMVRDGSLAEPVDRLTFAGNLKDLLARIAAVGSDLRWHGSNAGLTLFLEPMALGGQ